MSNHESQGMSDFSAVCFTKVKKMQNKIVQAFW